MLLFKEYFDGILMEILGQFLDFVKKLSEFRKELGEFLIFFFDNSKKYLKFKETQRKCKKLQLIIVFLRWK